MLCEAAGYGFVKCRAPRLGQPSSFLWGKISACEAAGCRSAFRMGAEAIRKPIAFLQAVARLERAGAFGTQASELRTRAQEAGGPRPRRWRRSPGPQSANHSPWKNPEQPLGQWNVQRCSSGHGQMNTRRMKTPAIFAPETTSR